MQYRTLLVADVPRVQCDEHGVTQVAVPWSDAGSRFTALFEALVIDWLGEASFSAGRASFLSAGTKLLESRSEQFVGAWLEERSSDRAVLAWMRPHSGRIRSAGRMGFATKTLEVAPRGSRTRTKLTAAAEFTNLTNVNL